MATPPVHGTLHHVEPWVPDLERASHSLGRLFSALGYARFQTWPSRASWRLGPTYIVLEQCQGLTSGRHDDGFEVELVAVSSPA
ncbi:hypothetical protein AB0M28_29570 [Streptomyces sp. NPDC051940]|uniref:hypothetical protein n=1 Tax=Streptomyces sp. NPDC051940 TaxID=3155675 RepID=UPI003428A784